MCLRCHGCRKQNDGNFIDEIVICPIDLTTGEWEMLCPPLGACGSEDGRLVPCEVVGDVLKELK